jgi:spoIIIJ-associated protein
MTQQPEHPTRRIPLTLNSTATVVAETVEKALESGAEQLHIPLEFAIVLGDPTPLEDGLQVVVGMDGLQMASDAAAMCEGLLERMGFPSKVDLLQRNGVPFVSIRAGDQGQLVIGRNGQNIDAIQSIVNRMLVRGKNEFNLVMIDCEDYLERHRLRLLDKAERALRQVERTGRPVALPPMGAADRKVIHNLLIDNPTVTTKSLGEDQDRHIVVYPVKANSPGE